MNSIFESRYAESERQYKLILQSDPGITRVDTCMAIKSVLMDIQKVLEDINLLPVNERLENYFHTYNGVLFVLDITQALKSTEFSFEAIDSLLIAIISLEGSLILQDAKYLDMRTKLYLEAAKLYEEQEAFSSAITMLTAGVQKLHDLMVLHESDPPVPEHIRLIISTDTKLLKAMLIKYKVQSGIIPVVDFRKKVDEQFQQDQELKLICLIQCLRAKRNKKVSIFEERKTGFKDTLITIGYQMIKSDLETITVSLEQQKIKIEKAVELQQSINMNLTQQEINEEIKRKREGEQKFIKEKDYVRALKTIPLEYHCELVHYAFEVKNQKIFAELAQAARVRIKYRSIEVPYITDITIIASDTTTPNIPNDYEKLPYDLNSANMKLELTKLRNSGKINPDLQSKEPIKQLPKDTKKQGKDSKGPVPIKQELRKEIATPWELEQIDHKYVYLLIKKSVYPQKALYGINVALGNQEKGPQGKNEARKIAVPYVQQSVSIKSTEVEQYTGVRSTTNQIPFLILFHSANSLSDEKQKKTVITDIKPIFGKNPMIRPSLGYTKIDVDLRQVPNEFIRSKSHEYVYLTYKTDGLFNIHERHTSILISFNDLQLTFGKSNNLANSLQQQKLLELGIDYSLPALNSFFETTYRSLGGVLGEQYYVAKTDFLTELCSCVWVKYLREPLCQMDYLMEQRLVGESNEYDCKVFKSIIERCKPIFLVGLKILNLVLASNKKTDMLLLCKVNLELAKILEETYQYSTGIQNIRVCLESIEKFRADYLNRGIEGKYDKLLPFSLTTSNRKLGQTLERIKERYLREKRSIAQMLRIRGRKENGQKRLTDQELKEEEFEFEVKYEQERVVNDITEFEAQQHTQIYLTVVAVETELTNCLIRLELKEGEKVRKLVKQRKRVNNKGMEETDEPITIKLKSSMAHQDTQLHAKKNLSELQGTLQKAGKIQATKPSFANQETKLFDQINKNPYKKSMLLLNLGAISPKIQQRKYLFQQCLKTLQKAYDEQQSMLDRSIDNSIYLVSRIYDNNLSKPSSIQVYPFNELYSSDWIQESAVPISPILISKTSSSITMKLPPFVPLVKQKDPTEYKLKKTIDSLTLYGKLSANGVDVSTNSNSLEGTGIKRGIGSIVEVRNLETNNTYCFACCATNAKSEQGGIGKTGEDIGTYNPLPLNLILGSLAKVSFQLNQYQIARSATQKIIDEYCEVTHFLDNDSEVSYLNYYRFKSGVLKGLCQIQLQYLSEALYISARCKTVLIDKQTTKHQRQRLVTNLIMLSNSLSSLLGTPLSSLPSFIPQQSVIERGLSLNLIPSKWMSPGLRMLSSKIMYNVLRWGLEHNQITLSRRITYKWIQKKWILLGKLIQVEEKKEVKKGVKESKDQQVKLIDKYVRMLVQKSPGVIDSFEDALITLHEEYSDYAIASIEKTKDQIYQYSQYTDTPQEEVERMISQLNIKLEFVELLKDPTPNIAKVAQNSLSYLQYSCKLFRRALEKGGDLKTITESSNQIVVDYSNPIIKTSKEIQQLMMEAIRSDIDWAPESIQQIKIYQQKTGEDLSQAITIFSRFIELDDLLKKQIREESILLDKNKEFRYSALWISEWNYLKALTLIISHTSKSKPPSFQEGYYNITTLNLEEITRRRKEIEVMDKSRYMQSAKNLEQLSQIALLLAEAVYYSSIISNWSIVQNILKTLFNLLSHCQLSPFAHSGSPLCEHLTFISLVSIEMLRKIKSHGYHTYRKEFQSRLKQKELAIIESKLDINPSTYQVVDEEEERHYHRPSLETKASKTYWFSDIPELQMQVVASIVCYNVQSLLIEDKHSLQISVIREFSNLTNHLHSLSFLPFLINSQQKILEKALSSLSTRTGELHEVEAKYNAWKGGKKKGSRQAQLVGEKPQEQIEYQTESARLKETIRLVEQKVGFLKEQQSLSSKIIEEIRRDSNQISLRQRENHRMLIQFGKDETRMFKQFGDENRLANNRKNTIKQLLGKYNKVLQMLQSSKDTKDELSQIHNLHEAGNLAFAIENIEDAKTHWVDCLSLITKSVNPVQTHRDMFQSKMPSPIEVIGLKQSLLSINILKKLASICYSRDLHLRRQALLMGSTFSRLIFKLNPQHPTLLEHFNLYRLNEISAGALNELRDSVTINLCQLLDSCQLISWGLIDADKPLLALPTICLMEHISTDIVKSGPYSMRSKLMKSLSSCSAGYIRESIISLLKCYYEKDMPIKWMEESEYLKREQGVNWPVQELLYNNSQPPYQKENSEVLEQLLKLDLAKGFEAAYGSVNAVLFQLCKAMILFSSNETEVSDNPDLNDQRAVMLIHSQNTLRACLKKLSFLEEFSTLLDYCNLAEIGYKLNEANDEKKEKYQQARANGVRYLKSQGVTEESEISFYFEMESTVERRIERLAFMGRIRIYISRISQSRCMWTRSFYVLKYGLWNMYYYSINARGVETGSEKENEEILVPVPQGKQPPPKKDDKKGAKKDPKQQVKEELVIDELQLVEQVSKLRERTTVSFFWHLRFELQIVALLYKQNRFKETLVLSKQIVAEADEYNEYYCCLMAQAFAARCKLKLGEQVSARELEKIITEMEENKLSDSRMFLELVGDCSQLLSTESGHKMLSEREPYLQSIAEEVGIKSYLLSQNYNSLQKQYCAQLQLSPEAEEEIKRKMIKKPIDGKKGGKDQKKGGLKKEDPKKKKEDQKLEYKIRTLTRMEWSNLNTQEKSTYLNINPGANSTQKEINCYIKQTPLYLKYKLRKVERYLQLDSQKLSQKTLEENKQTLKDIQKIVSKSYGLSASILLTFKYLQSKILQSELKFKFDQFISSNKDTLSPKLIKRYNEGLPLNPELITVPSFEEFVFSIKPLMESIIEKLKECTNLIKNQCLLYENSFNTHKIFFSLGYHYLLLARYQGRAAPKYIQIGPTQTDALLEQQRAQKITLIEEARKYLSLGMEMKRCIKQLNDNYCEIGKKVFEVGAYKLDPAIEAQILQIDYLSKKEEVRIQNELNIIRPRKQEPDKSISPQGRTLMRQASEIQFDETKKKTAITFIDILTYILKLHRESKVMTFSSPHLQSTITKCHKALFSLLPLYKQKCVLKDIDKKPDKVENDSITFSVETLNNQHILLYVLGPDSETNSEQTIQGHILLSRRFMNEMSCSTNNLKEKMEMSDKKSLPQKERDYRFHNQEYQKILRQVLEQYLDEKSKDKEAVAKDLKGLVPQVNYPLIDILINIFDEKGVSEVNKAMNSFFRYAHRLNVNK